MISYMPAFLVLAVLAAVMLWLAGRRRPRIAAALALALTVTAYTAATEPLGHAKPMRLEFLRDLDGAEVSYFEASEADGIYIVTGRLSYTTPYTERLARELHEASRRAESEGGTVRLREGTEGGEPSAGWVPPPPAPPKD